MTTSQKPKGWFSKGGGQGKTKKINTSSVNLRAGLSQEPEETIFEDHFPLKKLESKKKSLELKEGSYRLDINVQERFMPTRYCEGSITLTDKAGHRINPVTNFAVRGSTILGNRWKCRFSVTAAAAPATLSFELTCHTVRAGSELNVNVVVIRQGPASGDENFEYEGEAIDPKSPHSARSGLDDSTGVESDLTDEERKVILEAFKEADRDGSGELDFEEFFLLLKKLHPTLSLPDANRIYARVDKDRSNSISENEFLEAVAYYRWDMAKISKVAHPAPSKPVEKPFEWEIPYEELQIGAKLGEGAFGIVYKAKWRGIAVAVKELKYTNLTPEVLEEFRKEISILAKLRHPNVVLFMGASTHPPHLCMVTEYLSGGNLYEVLHEKKMKINPVMLVQMAWQTALGLNYLHLSTPQILHRDLKPMNLLLDSNANVKLCDFGLSCVKEKRAVVTESVGSPFWMAPEVLMGRPYNEKADVYSFGVLLYEFLTATIPMSETVVDEKTLQKVLQQICAGHRAPIPPYIPTDLKEVINSAWANDPNQRPAFSDIVDRLEAIHTNLSQQALAQKLAGGPPQHTSHGAPQYAAPLLSAQRMPPPAAQPQYYQNTPPQYPPNYPPNYPSY